MYTGLIRAHCGNQLLWNLLVQVGLLHTKIHDGEALASGLSLTVKI